MKQNFFQHVLVLSATSFLCCLWSSSGCALTWSEGSHKVFWFWGFLGGTSEQVNIIFCLQLTLGYLLASFAGPGSAWIGPSCGPWPVATSIGPGEGPLKAQNTLYSAFARWLPLGLSTEMVSVGTQVVCGRFSVNHLVGVNGVHQVSTQCQY